MPSRRLATRQALLLVLPLLALGLTRCGQTADELARRQTQIMAETATHGDYLTAIVAANQLLAMHPDDQAVRDSLASYYDLTRQYPSALHHAQVLVRQADSAPSPHVWGIVGRSYYAMQQYDSAAIVFQQALDANDTASENGAAQAVLYRYKLAESLYRINEIDSANGIMAQLAQDPDASAEALTLQDQSGRPYQVPYAAAAQEAWAYAKALVDGNFDAADSVYAELLQGYPQFYQARVNYQQIKQQQMRAQMRNQGR